MNWCFIVSIVALPSEPLPPVSCPQVRVVDTHIHECLVVKGMNCYCSQTDAWKKAQQECGPTDAVLFVKSKLQGAGCL
jgi:hypothetical protein